MNRLSGLFHKRGCSIVNNPFMNRHLACSTRDEFYCGPGILPVKREWCNIAVLKKVRYAQCPMPYALCPMPYALCPMLNALCPIVPHVTEKGYISVPTDNANPELRHLFQRRQVRQLAADIPTAESQISQTILNSADCERKLSP